MTDFDTRAAARWARGIAEHRGGDPEAPFAGDPLAELLEELEDVRNYASEAERQKILAPSQAAEVARQARELWRLVQFYAVRPDRGRLPKHFARAPRND